MMAIDIIAFVALAAVIVRMAFVLGFNAGAQEVLWAHGKDLTFEQWEEWARENLGTWPGCYLTRARGRRG